MARDYLTFLREALTALFERRVIGPALALVVLLTVSNIVILTNAPREGASPIAFILAAIVRVLGLIWLQAAILRLVIGAGRSPYRPDGAFWLFLLIVFVELIASVALQRLAGLGEDVAALALSNVLTTIALAPLAAWSAAAAVERPLAWDPRPWLSGFARWLPQFIGWALLLITPIAVLHAMLDRWLIAGAGDWFWPVILFDGPLSTVIALLGLGLNAAAYAHVAQARASRLSASPSDNIR